MLKRWRKLPQAGVGLLGLALLTFSLNADAASHSFKHEKMLFGGTASEIKASASLPATPLPAVQEFSSAGSGIINLAAPASACTSVGLNCNPGDSCQCVTMTGSVTDGVGPLFSGPFLLTLNVDEIGFDDGNDQGQICFFATGVLALTPGSNATINFITAGAGCNGIDNANALYSGGFTIGPSTGGFSDAIGSGILGFGANKVTKIGIFDLKGAGSNIN